MIPLETATAMIALVFTILGESMIVRWRVQEQGKRSVRQLWTGVIPLMLAGMLLFFASNAFKTNNLLAITIFWIVIGLIGSLPAILLLIAGWPKAIEWGLERTSPIPPFAVVGSGLLFGVALVVVTLLAMAFAPEA
jgi:hypothetical protein